MRFWISLLVSTNVHVWTFSLLVMHWAMPVHTSEPKTIELSMYKLPAMPMPGNGGEIAEQSTSRTRSGPHSTGPSVQYTVTVSKSAPTPESKMNPSESLYHSPLPPLPESEMAQLEHGSASSNMEAKQHSLVAVSVPKTSSLNVDNVGDDEVLDMDPGGDPRPLVKIIQARIDEVTPLIHKTSGDCSYEQGVVKIIFRISPHGYTASKRITNSSGARCLDEVAEKVLHMAEPFPHVAGWVPVTVKFTL